MADLKLSEMQNMLGYTLTGNYHMFLSCNEVQPKKNYPVKWFYSEELISFYGDKRFLNAICQELCIFQPI